MTVRPVVANICRSVGLLAIACVLASLAAPPIVRSHRLQDARTADALRRRALLVGIDDYSDSGRAPGVAGRWRNLEGAVNDVRDLREMLMVYGFAPRDILVLSNRRATRAAILGGIENHLLAAAEPGDIALFYFTGHGSQVRNSLSGEPDMLDESLVPADSRRGAPDLRDKELSRIFNRLLDQGIRLTVILDSCHSGSGVRGLPASALPRALPPDLRDVVDGAPSGPRPEDRGALVFSASQDFDLAWETRDEVGEPHGAFSLALLRALRDAASGEPAEQIFLRARARLQAERYFQEPVLAGNSEARSAPFLGDRSGRRTGGSVIAVEKVKSDGTVILQGGWVNGLAVGSEVRLPGTGPEVHLEVTSMTGLSRCEARVISHGRSASFRLEPGALAQVVGWTVPPDRPLRVWIPETAAFESAFGLAKELARSAPRRGVEWIDDPTEKTPTHVLRWVGSEWELHGPGNLARRLGPATSAGSILARIQAPAPCLFVQLPAPSALARSMILGPHTDHSGVEPVRRPGEGVDYVLAGRLSGGRPEFAWLRPGFGDEDAHRTILPVRTAWQAYGGPVGTTASAETAGFALENTVLRLRKIQAWQVLEAPEAPAYRLALRNAADGALATEGILRGGEKYGLVLRAANSPPGSEIRPRYVYAFLIDTKGRSLLLFPPSGSVENRVLPPSLPEGPSPAASPIPLGSAALFEIAEPFGRDTYFLLTSDETIPNPWVLEWDGVQTRGPRGRTPLEELLSVTGGARRGERLRTTANWTLERLTFTSVPPGVRRAEASPQGRPKPPR